MFIDDDCILSKEGTTQGDPLAMSIVAVALIPLIRELDELTDVIQLWYRDDATVTGEMSELRKWCDNINTLGKPYGYFPNACKTVLLVREELYERACRYFEGSNVMIRTNGVKLLGSPIDTEPFMESQFKSKFESWTADMDLLSDIAESQPQPAYAAFVHGVYSRWTYFCRSCSVPVDHLNC